MSAFVHMYRKNFQPGRMCDNPALLYAGQVRTREGRVLARASRVYDQWSYTDPAGVSHLLDHPGFPNSPGYSERHAALTAELIGHLVAIAKGYNISQEGEQA